MTAPVSFRFEGFVLDSANRLLLRDGAAVELNARYFDALLLLVREGGKLVSKDRFLDEVWRGVPVTDEALTQCIKTLRRQLGDSAVSPRFIETVPKHGYRFIATVETGDAAEEAVTPAPESRHAPPPGQNWQKCILLAGAGTIGAGMAGLIGGLFYGFAGASQPLQPGMGAASVLLVLLCVTILMALIGGAGVALGIAVADFAKDRPWLRILGGAAGGLIVGGVVKLLGLDAFNLLFGQSPGDITGTGEGVVLGGAVGLGAWLASRGANARSLRHAAAMAAMAGAAAGIAITLLGGRLMAGSLALLSRQFPESRLRLDQIGGLLGESGFGRISEVVTGGLEGALFAGCIVGAMLIARRDLER